MWTEQFSFDEQFSFKFHLIDLIDQYLCRSNKTSLAIRLFSISLNFNNSFSCWFNWISLLLILLNESIESNEKSVTMKLFFVLKFSLYSVVLLLCLSVILYLLFFSYFKKKFFFNPPQFDWFSLDLVQVQLNNTNHLTSLTQLLHNHMIISPTIPCCFVDGSNQRSQIMGPVCCALSSVVPWLNVCY